MYGIYLILVLVITGGAIAFIGDRLGSKVGKKRMSLFGLRPKHTSIIVTIATGILITTTSLAIMSLASENVRTALFGMEKLNESMNEARTELAKTSSELSQAQQDKEIAQQNLDETQQVLTNLQAQQGALEQRAAELQAGNSQLEAANNELTASNQQLEKSRNELQAGNNKLQQENKELDEKNQYLSTGIQIMREGDITFRAGEVLASGVVDGNRPVAAVDKDLQQLVAVARNNVANRLGNEAQDREKEIWLYQPEYDAAEQFISTSKSDIVVRIVAAGNLVRGEPVKTYLNLYKNKVIFNDGDLIATKNITLTQKDPENIQIALGTFLNEVNNVATEKGMLADPITGAVGRIDAEQVFDIIRQMSTVQGPSVIISAFAKGVADVLGPLQIKLKVIAAGGSE